MWARRTPRTRDDLRKPDFADMILWFAAACSVAMIALVVACAIEGCR